MGGPAVIFAAAAGMGADASGGRKVGRERNDLRPPLGELLATRAVTAGATPGEVCRSERARGRRVVGLDSAPDPPPGASRRSGRAARPPPAGGGESGIMPS